MLFKSHQNTRTSNISKELKSFTHETKIIHQNKRQLDKHHHEKTNMQARSHKELFFAFLHLFAAPSIATITVFGAALILDTATS